MDSEFDRKVALNVPTGVPGRGQVPQKLHFMTALPRLDSTPDVESLSEATAQLVQAVKVNWAGPPAPTVRLLPRKLPADQLPKGFEFPSTASPSVSTRRTWSQSSSIWTPIPSSWSSATANPARRTCSG